MSVGPWRLALIGHHWILRDNERGMFMRIGIVGGGPAGLFFALLMKQHESAHDIDVWEQNPAGATYGWGVVFSKRALAFIEESAPDLYRDISRITETWDEQTIVLNGTPVTIDGFGFSALARIDLLKTLQQHAARAGANLHFEQRIMAPADLSGYDLVVGADGVNSVVRSWYPDAFHTELEPLQNRYIWYGTPHPFRTLTLAFREYKGGVYVAHAYRFQPNLSTFIVECDAATWESARLGMLSDEESQTLCARIFEEELEGSPLLSNKSSWGVFRVVHNHGWVADRVALLGDAMRTVHFSIGSGTRSALEDSAVLFRSIVKASTLRGGLLAYETDRREQLAPLLGVARRSAKWYESMGEKMVQDPVQFAHDYLMRGGELTEQRLLERSPQFMKTYQAIRPNRSGEEVT